jgi:hypothetical protein
MQKSKWGGGHIRDARPKVAPSSRVSIVELPLKEAREVAMMASREEVGDLSRKMRSFGVENFRYYEAEDLTARRGL